MSRRAKLAAAYTAASQLRALSQLGNGGRSKTANLQRALADNALAGLLGGGVGAAIDDDSALQGALIGAAGGVGAHQLSRLLSPYIQRSMARGVTDAGGLGYAGGEPTAALRNLYSLGAGAAGLGGGLGGVGVANMIDDDDESVLARLGLR
jgi:hypothetical protein